MDPKLLARLEEAELDLAEVEQRLASPDVDPSEYAALGRRHSELSAITELTRAWRAADTDWREAEDLAVADPDLAGDLMRLAEERRRQATRLETEIRDLLTPVDPFDGKDVLVEIRAAAGGDEAAIWAGDLARMYQRWADRLGFKVETIESSPSEAGGFSKVTVAVKGHGAYSKFKFEAGVHRVQRVPRTESQGRIHTSTATVAVFPETDETESVLDSNDVRVDVFRSSGPGGQSVNTTDSAVRLTHLPTGLVVTCQDEKSQLQNKEKAFRILRARLAQMEADRRHAEVAGERRAQVGSGDRSEKIRTYNFKDGRVTDHRAELTIYRLEAVLDGDLAEFVDTLTTEERAASLLAD
jgi:peptide chain release factor 1